GEGNSDEEKSGSWHWRDDGAIVGGIPGVLMNRRELLQSAGAVLVTPALAAANIAAQTPAADDRGRWLALMGRLAEPVLTNLAGATLKQRMPAEQAAGAARRAATHLKTAPRLHSGV